MVRYPHTIIITGEASFEQDETTGKFKPAGDNTPFTSKCNSGVVDDDVEKKGVDGQIVKYEWLVSMPQTDRQFQFGDKVSLVRSEGTYETTVKRQSNGQHNTLIWL